MGRLIAFVVLFASAASAAPLKLVHIPSSPPGDSEHASTLRPRSLATADLDEDGSPDRLTAFSGGAAGGMIRVHRGRAGLRSVSGAATLEAVAEVSMAPEFLATGDFDADGHIDAVTAERGAAFLTALNGDGAGSLTERERLSLPGSLDALTAFDVNRQDGLVDLVAAVRTSSGPRLLVFESPEGAFNATPERIALPAEAVAIAVADLDADFINDIVVATRTTLVIVRGRDRRLAGSSLQRTEVPPPIVRSIPLASPPVAMTAGRFMSGDAMGIAILDENGILSVAEGRSPQTRRALPTRYRDVSSLTSGYVRGGSSNDLIVLEKTARKLHLVRPDDETDFALDLDAEPLAALPARLDADALDDLVLLSDGAGADAVATALTSIQSTFVVTNINDSGAGSLRQAILDANNAVGPDTITFNIPGSGVHVMLPLSAFPPLLGSVTLDATTQPGYAGSPRVEIDGSNAGPGVDGLTLNSGGNVVRGLDLHGFSGSGIVIDGAGHNVVEACDLGTDPSGAFAIANGDAGVLIRNSHLNTIGGTTVAARNVISGNGGRNVAILGSAANAGTFVTGGPGVTICDLCTVSLPIAVPIDERLTYVYVQVNIQHTFDSDLRLTLVAPDGTRVLLSASNGGSGDNYTNTIFDDQAVTPVGAGSAPFSGSYIPQQPLSALNGKSVQGTWSFEVEDAVAGDSGFLFSWRLSLASVTTFGNVIEGNLIGTDATGTSALTSSNGVVIDQSPANLVGGTSAGARNIISGASGQNAGNGILISGPLAIQNVIQGNYIGTNLTGASGVPNQYAGILLSSVSKCLVGGTAAGAGNLVSGNGVWGMRADVSDHIDVLGNLVGTNASGTVAIGNAAENGGGAGIVITDGTSNTVGGSVAAARNVISGNVGQSGLTFFDYNPGCCAGNVGIGNYIGTDITGTQALPNQTGVYLRSHGGVLGGSGPGEGNVISGSTYEGVLVSLNTDGTVVSGNIIGLDRTGTATLGNGFGISLLGRSVTIGGSAPGAGNTIAGNVHQGIFVDEDCPSDVVEPASTDTPKFLPDVTTTTSSVFEPLDEVIRDFQVKVDLSHTFDSDLVLTLIGPDGTRVTLANRRGGSGDNYTNTVFEAVYSSTPIGAGSPPFTGTFAAEEPLPVFLGQSAQGTWTLEISDVAGGDTGFLWSWSISFSTDEVSNDRIVGNMIGTNAAGATGLGNLTYGIEVDTFCGLRIGGASPGERNVISGNGSHGLWLIAGYTTPSIAIQGNLIGVNPDGTTPLGNGGSGIYASGEIGMIGGSGPAFGNVIAYNAGAGVAVSATNTYKQTAIRANSIHDNGGLGIDLELDGVTLNDSNDADFGANLLQNFPAVTSVGPFFNGTLISGTLSSAPNSKFMIDVYANQQGDASGYGEGQTWLGNTQISTDGLGNASWNLFTALTGIHFVAATATDFVGNTSEFSGAFSAPMEASPAGDVRLGPNGGTSLRMSYTPACGATNHVVYWGLAGPQAIGNGGLVWIDSACALGTSGTAIFDPGTPPAGKFFYFVIVGHNAVQEGSYGKNASGAERPEAVRVGSCDHTQVLPQTCQ